MPFSFHGGIFVISVTTTGVLFVNATFHSDPALAVTARFVWMIGPGASFLEGGPCTLEARESRVESAAHLRGEHRGCVWLAISEVPIERAVEPVLRQALASLDGIVRQRDDLHAVQRTMEPVHEAAVVTDADRCAHGLQRLAQTRAMGDPRVPGREDACGHRRDRDELFGLPRRRAA
ncbi:MAG: hypothetical protein IPG17_18425 [Sandaracinaceae bacterium]|nr:hypothetical protein [Sandaracinaceae bacterium]